MLSFKEYMTETVGQAGLDYELKVYKALKDAKIEGLDPGEKPGAGFSNVGSGDIEAMYKGKNFNIEIKASAKDQMGGGSLRYDRSSKQLIPSPKLAASTEPEDLAILMKAAESKMPQINKYLDFLKTQEPKKVHAEYAKAGVPFICSQDAREAAVKGGYQKAIQSYVKLDSRYITNLYNGKNVYYIQIGKAGLFYMGKNPLNLPVPAFKGEINVEVRIGYAGDTKGSTSRAFSKKAGSEEVIQARRAELRCIGRMLTKSKSPYSLDNPKDVQKLFGEK
jgi:hypothetical protein